MATKTLERPRRLKLREEPETESPADPAPPKAKLAGTILEEKLISDFCSLIQRGLPVDGCCDYLCVHQTSFWTWMRKGERFLAGAGAPNDDQAIYGRFVMSMRRAMAVYRLGITDRLHKDDGDDEKAKNWFRDLSILERRDRKTWGRNDPLGGNEETMDVDERFL